MANKKPKRIRRPHPALMTDNELHREVDFLLRNISASIFHIQEDLSNLIKLNLQRRDRKRRGM